MDNIQELKDMWTKLNGRLDRVESENQRLANEIKRSNYKTVRERLISRYWRFVYVAAVMILFISVFISTDEHIDDRYRWYTLGYWIFYLCGALFLDLYLIYGLKGIDVYNESVMEISSKARRNWRIHKLGIIAGMPLAIGLMILYALSLGAETPIVLAMLCGVVIGLAIGFRQLREFWKGYRELQRCDEE